MRKKEGIGFGLLPTARSSMKNGASAREVAEGNPKKRLETEIAMLKTPSASEAEGGWKVTDKYWNAKAPKLKMRDQVGRKTGLKLQPNFVAWMMGFPLNWTDLNSPSPKIERNNSKHTETR